VFGKVIRQRLDGGGQRQLLCRQGSGLPFPPIGFSINCRGTLRPVEKQSSRALSIAQDIIAHRVTFTPDPTAGDPDRSDPD
jgi:hypothetical protein